MKEESIAAPKGFYHFMVKRFLKEGRELTKGIWAREIKIAKKLFNKHPDVQFWNRIGFGFHLNSLAWFLSEEGSYALRVRGKMSILVPQRSKSYSLSEKIGKNKKIIRKNKTLMEILNEPKKN